MKSIENTSVVGVSTAEITVEMRMEYILYEAKNILEVKPKLDRI